MSALVLPDLSAQDCAAKYRARGWSPLPIPPGEKNPGFKEWQKFAADAATPFDGNVGVLLGKPSGGLCDVDLDCPESLALAPDMLPPTDAIFGRAGKPRSHWLYLCEPETETKQFQFEKTMIVEMRATGGQTVFPGSVHPSGERIEWERDGKPAAIEAERLLDIVGDLAGLALLCRNWPEMNGRYNVEGALIGALLRVGRDQAEIVRLIEIVHRHAGKSRDHDPHRSVPRLADRLTDGAPVPGATRLRELLGADVANKLADWLRFRGSEDLDEMNGKYAVVRVGNKVAIMDEHMNAEGEPTLSLLGPDAFKLLLANRWHSVKTKTDDGKTETKRMPMANWWLSQTGRRQYEGITFAPNATVNGFYNLWKGFGVQPAEGGSCEKFKAHLLDNVCGGNTDLFRWVFGWYAAIFQKPAQKCGTSLVLRGAMGVGKTIVGETFGRLLGVHYVQIADPRYVTGRFNSHMEKCLLLHCDEAFWAGDHAAEGKLKDLVTGRRHPIEFKGFEAIFVPNFIRLFVDGNPNWLVPAGMDERRFATLDVLETHKQDIPYFGEIAAELGAGGYERLLWELLRFDLGSVELRVIPATKALLDQKISSLTPEQAWWLDVLKEGQLPLSDRDDGSRCPGGALYSHYIAHAQKVGARRRQIETAIGIFMREMVPGLSSKVESYEVPDGAGFVKTVRGTVYHFPKLDRCRQAFTDRLRQDMGWGEPVEWIARQD